MSFLLTLISRLTDDYSKLVCAENSTIKLSGKSGRGYKFEYEGREEGGGRREGRVNKRVLSPKSTLLLINKFENA